MPNSNHQTHGTTSWFTLTNNFRNQNDEMKEAKELFFQIDEFKKGESGYTLDSITKLPLSFLDTTI